MIKLYGMYSPYVMRVKAALEFKGLDYEQISVDLKNKTEEFLSMNPNGKIPTFVDSDGTVVYESGNIVAYLDQKYPDTYKMISSDLNERIKQFHLVGIVDNIYNISAPVVGAKFRGQEPTEDQIEAIKPKITDLSNAIIKMYNGQDYLIGNFSYADACIIGFLYFTNKFMPQLISPELLQWYNKLSQNDEVKRILPN